MKKSEKLRMQLAVAKGNIERLKEENLELQLIIDTLSKKNDYKKAIPEDAEDNLSKLEKEKNQELIEALKKQVQLLETELAAYKPYEELINELRTERDAYIEALKGVFHAALFNYNPVEDMPGETRTDLFYQDRLIKKFSALPVWE